MNESHHPAHPEANDPLPEGEEQAPPGTRTMALIRWGLVGLMAAAAAGAWVYYAASAGVFQKAEARYHCPMHPQIITAHRGECPICGMDLVPIDPSTSTSTSTSTATPTATPTAREPLYTCPMHPDFVTSDPKARCPECGMKLVPRAPAGQTTAARPPHAQGVPGLAPVELTADRVQLIGMRTAPVVREPLGSTLHATGFVTANETGLVSVTTRYSGWIESLGEAQTGQLVQKGEVLATVYSPEMLNAQQVFLNAIKWSDTSRIPGQGTPTVANDLQRDARLRLELLGIAREDVEAISAAGKVQQAVSVRAPVRGYIARKSALKGLFVSPGTEIFQIADLSTVWVLVDVYERQLGRVKVGQKAVFSVESYPGQTFSGRVQFIYPALNTGSRTLQARLDFRNPGLKLRPGMYGDAVLYLGDEQALVVPKEAVVDTGETQYVFVDRGAGRFEPRRVRAGWTSGDKVAVIEGLAEGERVVTTANFLVDSESRLRAAIQGFQGGPSSAGDTGREGR